MTEQASTTGVQELIDRLSQEGVAEGQRQAEKLVSDAQRKADEMLEAARRQANDILKQAREDADQFQAAGEEALRLACRDSVRDFAAQLHDGWRNRLQELVQCQMKEPKLIKRMILEITRSSTDQLADEQLEILISPEIISEDEVREQIAAGDEDALTEFVRGLLGEDLRQGFSVDLAGPGQEGLVVRVVNQNVELDLTDEAISNLLAQHLLPRFRAVMRAK